MSKTKSDKIPSYELLYLISNQYSEDEVKPIIEKVNLLITGNHGEIIHGEELGKKRLAYPIKGFRFGNYILLQFSMPGANLARVDRALSLMSEILRQQIVQTKIKTQEQIEEDRRIAAKIAARNVQQEEKIAKEKLAAAAKETAKDKVDLKDLDEKLDKILETENLL